MKRRYEAPCLEEILLRTEQVLDASDEPPELPDHDWVTFRVEKVSPF